MLKQISLINKCKSQNPHALEEETARNQEMLAVEKKMKRNKKLEFQNAAVIAIRQVAKAARKDEEDVAEMRFAAALDVEMDGSGLSIADVSGERVVVVDEEEEEVVEEVVEEMVEEVMPVVEDDGDDDEDDKGDKVEDEDDEEEEDEEVLGAVDEDEVEVEIEAPADLAVAELLDEGDDDETETDATIGEVVALGT